MKVDGALVNVTLGDVPARARQLEVDGYDGLYTFEGPHDPFLPLALAAEHTDRVDLMTAIAIAFARNPMTLAQIGDDLQRASQGRMILGLGSQIKPHIERRFSMEWSRPAARMRELVLAIRAIWRTWHDREPLDFRGDFYNHTLMTPFFDPGPIEFGPPRIALAGVGPLMTEVAGEVADIFFIHPFGSVASMEDVTFPALERGARRAGRTVDDIEISLPVMCAMGETDEELESARDQVRLQIAFYGSTPAYRVVLDVHGWGDLQPELRRLTKEDRWDEMSALVSDEIVDTIAVVGRPEQVAETIRERYSSRVQRIAFNTPLSSGPERWRQVLASLQNG